MRTIVSKFGGSSTANAARLRRVLEIVRASPARRLVVLSAPGTDERHPEKVTALLEACWRARADRAARAKAIGRVSARFAEIAGELGLSQPREAFESQIARAVGISRAHTLSRGEYLCAKLFSAYSGLPMVDAAQVIRFDGDGGLDESRTRERLQALAGHTGRIVLPGFYGAGPDGRIHTFPLNGSDITGAVAAAGLDAALYENWTDVPGLMTADPDLAPGARLVRQVGYRQMRALARAGARVLHPACLDPVALSGIPTRLRCTFDTASFGTLIDDACDAPVPCLAASPDRTVITAFGLPRERVTAAASDLGEGVSVESAGDVIRVRVPAERCADCLRALHRRLIEEEGKPRGLCV